MILKQLNKLDNILKINITRLKKSQQNMLIFKMKIKMIFLFQILIVKNQVNLRMKIIPLLKKRKMKMKKKKKIKKKKKKKIKKKTKKKLKKKWKNKI